MLVYIQRNWFIILLAFIALFALVWAGPDVFGGGSGMLPTSEGAYNAVQNSGYTNVQVSGPQYLNLYNLCGEEYTVYFNAIGTNSNNMTVSLYVCGRPMGGGYLLKFR